ncbi:uncharacterized protein LOC129738079 [Uranotaenia lowii]|uniref:uncharacterized protein LOC129738079 n=1 Tax=Uranotaenia lowii TaxID=190385 RepID=UPI0024796C3A|nr:uncharacterized protein LOC129738079 [Uranotaenia lowii]
MSYETCRLCGYNSPDTIELFGEQGVAGEYVKKIGRYLYLLVQADDDLAKTVCWMCTQQLDSFHRFHGKINEIQQRLLKDRYPEFVIEMQQKFPDDTEEIEIIQHTELMDLEDSVKHESSITLLDTTEFQPENIECEKESVLILKPPSFVPLEREKASVLPTDDNHTLQASSVSIPLRDENDLVEILNPRKRLRTYSKLSKSDKNQSPQKIINQTGEARKSPRKVKLKPDEVVTIKETPNVENPDYLQDSHYSEEEEEEEFSPRDPENEEWPAAGTMEQFPTEIICNGSLTIRGAQLMSMVNKFYNMQCQKVNLLKRN